MAKLSGLLRSALAEPDMHAVREADLRTRPMPALRVEGPAALRPFLAAALAGRRTAPCWPSPPPTGRPKTSAPPPRT